MQKIDKSKRLATAYHKWVEELESTGEDHGLYNDGPGRKFHKDVLMNLIACQNGLCAYTEVRIGDPKLVEASNWKDGRFNGLKTTKADIDHFDPNLKLHKAWLWDNLFAVDIGTNQRVKGYSSVDDILKPDAPDYDPFQLLSYEIDYPVSSETHDLNHRFVPHPALSEDVADRVNRMINVLGLNDPTVRKSREDAFGFLIEEVQIGLKKELKTDLFPTAREMIRRKLTSK